MGLEDHMKKRAAEVAAQERKAATKTDLMEKKYFEIRDDFIEYINTNFPSHRLSFRDLVIKIHKSDDDFLAVKVIDVNKFTVSERKGDPEDNIVNFFSMNKDLPVNEDAMNDAVIEYLRRDL